MNIKPIYINPTVPASRRTLCRAFTLIELLIVVAIIAVLAAIAVPNFLEAQTRSKISRVKADHRSIATGLETYLVDHNTLPYSSGFFTPMPSQRLLSITTPIAYLNTVPEDVFRRKDTGNSYEVSLRMIDPDEPLNVYLYNRATTQNGAGEALTAANKVSYSLTSAGPDRLIHFAYYAFSADFVEHGNYTNYIYDATNGTNSRGEIFRRGGGAQVAVPGIDGN